MTNGQRVWLTAISLAIVACGGVACWWLVNTLAPQTHSRVTAWVMYGIYWGGCFLFIGIKKIWLDLWRR